MQVFRFDPEQINFKSDFEIESDLRAGFSKSYADSRSVTISQIADKALHELNTNEIPYHNLLSAYRTVERLKPKKISLSLRILSIFNSNKRAQKLRIIEYNASLGRNWPQKRDSLLARINEMHRDMVADANSLDALRYWLPYLTHTPKLDLRFKAIDAQEISDKDKLHQFKLVLHEFLHPGTYLDLKSIRINDVEKYHRQAADFINEPNPQIAFIGLKNALKNNYIDLQRAKKGLATRSVGADEELPSAITLLENNKGNVELIFKLLSFRAESSSEVDQIHSTFIAAFNQMHDLSSKHYGEGK